MPISQEFSCSDIEVEDFVEMAKSTKEDFCLYIIPIGDEIPFGINHDPGIVVRFFIHDSAFLTTFGYQFTIHFNRSQLVSKNFSAGDLLELNLMDFDIERKSDWGVERYWWNDVPYYHINAIFGKAE